MPVAGFTVTSCPDRIRGVIELPWGRNFTVSPAWRRDTSVSMRRAEVSIPQGAEPCPGVQNRVALAGATPSRAAAA